MAPVKEIATSEHQQAWRSQAGKLPEAKHGRDDIADEERRLIDRDEGRDVPERLLGKWRGG
jgi:hypothetical protein